MKFAVFRFALEILAGGCVAGLRDEQGALSHRIPHPAMAHVERAVIDKADGQGLMECSRRWVRKVGDFEKLTYSFHRSHLELKFVAHFLFGEIARAACGLDAATRDTGHCLARRDR